MTSVITPKLQQIAERRKFASFWEAFSYFKLAAYDEVEALQIASELFNGDVWSNVINAAKATNSYSGNAINYAFVSGATYLTSISSSGSTYIMGTDVAKSDPDDLDVEIYVMTDKANPAYKAIYKAYVETRTYAPISSLETQIKIIKINLTTELAISIFNNGYKNF